MKKLFIFIILLFFAGCATTHIGPEDAPQPKPPKKHFSYFSNVYLKNVEVSKHYSAVSGTSAALIKIDENFKKEINEIFSNVQEYRKLNTDIQHGENDIIIEPYVEKIKFVSGGKRFMFGAFAGSSAVVLKVTFVDGNGNIIASPKFYQRAQAMGGGFSYGATDNTMLFRIAQEASAYIRKYY